MLARHTALPFNLERVLEHLYTASPIYLEIVKRPPFALEQSDTRLRV